jgi:hypothetical protein
MIRILTLLVSLFTFGLVDLAEITYEIPVTDMLYFNDTPIEELNGLTLNEVFIDNINTYNSTFAFFNQNLNSWSRSFSSSSPFNAFTIVIPTFVNNRIYVYFDLTSVSNLAVFNAYDGFQYNTIGNINTPEIKSFIKLANSYDRIAFNIQAINSNPSFIEFTRPLNYINLTSLGLTSLTKTQLDRYYELWQNPELNISYEINTLDTQDLIILLVSQSVWTIMIHLLYKYAYRPKKKSKRLGM